MLALKHQTPKTYEFSLDIVTKIALEDTIHNNINP